MTADRRGARRTISSPRSSVEFTDRPRMNVEMESVMYDAAGKVHLPHSRKIELIEEGRDVQSLVMGIALEIVGVDDQAAAGARHDRVEKAGRRVHGRLVG